MADFPDIYVIRHGQTVWNAAGRHQGRLNSPLTELGRDQAARVGERLLTLAPNLATYQVYSSPQGRARDTARIGMGVLEHMVQEDARLCEVAFGQWEGLTQVEIDAKWPELVDMGDMFSWHFTAPGGESFEELHLRASSFLSELKNPTVIFTHGITSRVLRGIWLGLDIDGMRDIGGGQGCIYQLSGGQQTRHDT